MSGLSTSSILSSPISAVDCNPIQNPLTSLTNLSSTISGTTITDVTKNSVPNVSTSSIVQLIGPSSSSTPLSAPSAFGVTPFQQTHSQHHALLNSLHQRELFRQHVHRQEATATAQLAMSQMTLRSDHLVDQFLRTDIQQQQAHHQSQQHQQRPQHQLFESLFEQQQLHSLHQAAIQPPSQWAKEFEQQSLTQFSPLHTAPQQSMTFGPTSAPSYAFSRPLFNPLSMSFSSMQSSLHAPLQQPFPLSISASSLPQFQRTRSEEKAESEEALYEKAKESVEPKGEFVDSFVNQSSVSQSSSIGGGLDGEMLQKLMNSDNPKWRNSKFLKFVNKIKNGEIEFRDNQAIERPAAVKEEADRWATEYQSHFVDPSSLPDVTEQEAADWGRDFQQREGMAPLSDADIMSRIKEEEDLLREHGLDEEDNYDDETEEARQYRTSWQNFQGDSAFSSDTNFWQRMLDQATVLPDGEAKDPEYAFSHPIATNPYFSEEHQQSKEASPLFEEGVRLLEAGRLREAIQALEAAVSVDADHSEAWRYLGQARAENEEEGPAIAALLKSISLDPYNLPALMMLGVSYTNDLEERRALTYLKTWLENNPDYAGDKQLESAKQNVRDYETFYSDQSLDGPADLRTGLSDSALHDSVSKMFLRAVAIHPEDADLWTVLGVLYHLSSDFDKAIDSFKQALKLRPQDAQLWNKLGATQANSSRSADAIHAYKRALSLRPSYTRAMANLAIAHANQGMHEDAVIGYLRALQGNASASHIWSYLRISLSHLGKDKLVELTHSKDVDLFRQYYDF